MSTFPLTDKQIFQKVRRDAIRNAIFFGIVLAVIILVGKLSWWLGIVPAGIYTAILGFDVIRVTFTTILALITTPINIYQKRKGVDTGTDEKYLVSAQLIEIVETAVSIFYLYLLYRTFFK